MYMNTKLTLAGTDRQDLISLEIALKHYLQQFSSGEVETAHPASNIARVKRLTNQVVNLLHGCDLNYLTDRTPILAYDDDLHMGVK